MSRAADSVIVDEYSGQKITLSKKVNTLNYSQVEGVNKGEKELACNKIVVPRGGEYMLVLSMEQRFG